MCAGSVPNGTKLRTGHSEYSTDGGSVYPYLYSWKCTLLQAAYHTADQDDEQFRSRRSAPRFVSIHSSQGWALRCVKVLGAILDRSDDLPIAPSIGAHLQSRHFYTRLDLSGTKELHDPVSQGREDWFESQGMQRYFIGMSLS